MFATILKETTEKNKKNKEDIFKDVVEKNTALYGLTIKNTLEERAANGINHAFLLFDRQHFSNTGIAKPNIVCDSFLRELQNPDSELVQDDSLKGLLINIDFKIWNNCGVRFEW